MIQMVKSIIFAALLVSAQVAASAYVSPEIFAWKGTAADKNLWILGAAPADAVEGQVTVKLLDADATFGTGAALVAYAGAEDGTAQKWTSTAAAPIAANDTTEIDFQTFIPANNLPGTDNPVLFHISEVNWVKNFADNAANNVDGATFFDGTSLAQTTTCKIETVSQRTSNTTEYQLDFKVECSGADVASTGKFVISILKQSLGNNTLGQSSNWATLCESSSVIETCDTDTKAIGAVAVTTGKLFDTFTFPASSAVTDGTSHYLTIVGTSTSTVVPNDAIIFTTAVDANAAMTHFSYGTCTTAACAPTSSSSSRIVSLAPVPVLAILVAMLQ